MSEEEKSAEASTEGLTEGIEKARAAVSQGVDAARERLKESPVAKKAKDLGDSARDRYGVAKDGIRQGYDRARKDLDQLAGDVNVYVRDNPGRSVVIAATVGFLVGFLLRGERRR